MADANTCTALFVIDIQGELANDPATQIPHADRVVQAGTNILQSARRAIADNNNANDDKTPSIIVFIQHEETDGGLVRGSEAWKLVFPPQSGVKTEILVSKTTRDTFESNRDLAQRLRDLNIGHIMAFGIQSECCVLSTCRGALAAGFGVTLLSGAHSTYDVGGKTAVEVESEVEAELKAKGAHNVPWEDVVKTWEKI